jgi:hypothetical protein
MFPKAAEDLLPRGLEDMDEVDRCKLKRVETCSNLLILVLEAPGSALEAGI